MTLFFFSEKESYFGLDVSVISRNAFLLRLSIILLINGLAKKRSRDI